MNFQYNDDAKELVRRRANIADVVGRYVNLKQRGRVMVGLCPFHKEKTPSFQVNPEMGFYYCFGCGKGGDVFKFVQEMEGLDFREALETLAETVGVELPRYERREPPGDGGRGGGASKTDLLGVNALAAEFFQKRVRDNPRAVDYFKSRGLSAETVKEFGLGYAPDGWRGLIDYLNGKNISPQRAVECGLAVSKDGGSPYDRFRDRVIFPICDLSGRVIAFAGRGMDAEAQPKYLNSPESALYKKSHVLYGLHKARDGIREHGYIIIVEGYMDYLTLYQAGVRNAAAASGTAFTEEHAHLIKRFTSKAALVFDGDRAGLSAAQRTALVLAPHGLQVSILALPGGDDPDSFVKREGPNAFLDLLAKALPAEDFLIDKFISESDKSPHGKSRVVDELTPYARALTDDIVRQDFLEKLARRLRLDVKLVAGRINAAKTPYPSGADRQPQTPAALDRGSAIGRLEADFLRILVAAPALIVWARRHFPPKNLIDPLAENIYSIILDVYAEKGDLIGLLDACGGDPTLVNLVSKLSVESAYKEHVEDELAQKVSMLHRKCIKARMADVRAGLADCSEEEKGPLMERLRDYGEQLREFGLRE
jgi:DNA primase